MVTSPSEMRFRIGREVLGPALCLHVHKVLRAVENEAIHRVYYVAREGHLLRALHERLAPLQRADAPARYLRVSRRSTGLPSVRRFGARELGMANVAPQHGLQGVLRAFDLLDEEVVATAWRAGVDDLSSPLRDPWDDARVQRLVDDEAFDVLVQARARRARERLIAYLRQEAFLDGGRVALVDVGWSGTIQDNLARVCTGLDGAPEVRGLYFGLFLPHRRPEDESPKKRGTVYEAIGAGSVRARAPLHFVYLFEQACRPDEGMTLGYATGGDGCVEAVLKREGADREAERRTHAVITELQAGVLDCADAWLCSMRDAGEKRLDEEAERVRDTLLRFIFMPRSDEIAALAELTYTEDLGSATWGTLLASSGLRPRRWIDGFYRSAWKPGYLSRSGGPGLGWAFRWYEELKVRLAQK